MVNQHLICFSCLFMRKCRSERVQLQPPCRPNIDILIINKSQHRSFFPPNKNALLSCSVHFISLWLNISCANFSICHFPFMFDIAIKSVYLFIPLHWLHSAHTEAHTHTIRGKITFEYGFKRTKFLQYYGIFISPFSVRIVLKQ